MFMKMIQCNLLGCIDFKKIMVSHRGKGALSFPNEVKRFSPEILNYYSFTVFRKMLSIHHVLLASILTGFRCYLP